MNTFPEGTQKNQNLDSPTGDPVMAPVHADYSAVRHPSDLLDMLDPDTPDYARRREQILNLSWLADHP